MAATTRQVADFARQVGGDRVAVRNIIPANADPHDFEPRPSDARAVADADVAVQSGGDLDAWLSGLLDNAGGDAERVSLIDSVKTIEGGHHHEDEHDEEDTAHAEDEHGESGEEVDPHWWQDPTNVELAVKRIAAAFAAADPSGKGTYEANAARYVRELRRLDKDISSCLDTVPAERRKLVTNHDAFGYFARRYDIEVLGSIIPALSTNAQPSAGDLRRLVEAIRRERVTTIFAESALNQRLEKAVARDAGVEVSAALYGDTLGPDENGTYVQALRHDASIIAKGFGAQCALDAG
ncbi:MAG TPA: metal ABC transporter substrate-binding protein [Solirubrobacteraceae bacterium]|nr:metal ABC transporter substrate-binding protein [Solirubrobacteraceae bacterium]